MPGGVGAVRFDELGLDLGPTAYLMMRNSLTFVGVFEVLSLTEISDPAML